MPTQIADQLSVCPFALAPDADAFAGTKTTDLFNMGLVLSACFLGIHAAGATGDYTITVEACDNNSGDNPVAIAFRFRQIVSPAVQFHGAEWSEIAATGKEIDAGANQAWQVGLVGSDMPDGKPWVRVKTVEAADSPVDGAIVFFADNLTQGPSEHSLT